MLFERYARYETFTMTDRKIAAFLRKQERERSRYPLFPQHIEAEQHSLDEEIVKRVRINMNSVQGSRTFRAQAWRRLRAAYFAQPLEVRERIKAEWAAWVGSRSPTYFGWMVDVHSGEQARRVAAANEQTAAIRARIRGHRPQAINFDCQ